MEIFEIALFLSTFLCSIVAGFLFAYAVIVMPGIASLDDKGFLKAFQVTDRVIQNNQPLFVLVWLGSVIAVISAAVLAFGRLAPIHLVLMELAALVYLLGVQGSTFAINLPLNRRLQSLNIDELSDAEARNERKHFEPRWNRANRIRTVLACGATFVFLVLM